MSRRIVSSFWNEHARATLPGNCSWSHARISSAASDSRSLGNWFCKEHLLQRVAAKPETERLERDDLLRRDVPEVDRRAEVLDEPRLRSLRRRLPDDVVEVELVRDLVDQPGAHVAVLAEDACAAAFARLGDDLPGAGVLLFLQPLHPLVGREHDLAVLRADLGEDREVPREVGDQLELALSRDLDRAVADLDVLDTEVVQPLLVLVEHAAHVDDLEERPADHDGLAFQHVELALQVLRDVRSPPAELDDVDVLAGHVEHVFPAARPESL